MSVLVLDALVVVQVVVVALFAVVVGVHFFLVLHSP